MGTILTGLSALSNKNNTLKASIQNDMASVEDLRRLDERLDAWGAEQDAIAAHRSNTEVKPGRIFSATTTRSSLQGSFYQPLLSFFLPIVLIW